MRICIVGTGYVGLVSAACFAEMGNDVRCVDVNPEVVALLDSGRIHIFEPGLEDLVGRNRQEGRLRFTTSLAEGLDGAEFAFITVGTPSRPDGSCDLSYVEGVARQIGEQMQGPLIVVDKSTVPVGTADRVRELVAAALAARGEDIAFDVVSNPEFLKEGDAVSDFMKPDRVIVGTSSEETAAAMRELYSPFARSREKLIVMGVRSAEMTKYAANCMLATKISFINEIATLCEKVGADVRDVRTGIGSDHRIGYQFIYPGIGYGGSCFPKDVKALARTAQEHGYTMQVIEAVERVNEGQKSILFGKLQRALGDLHGKTIAIWGLAFKPETDDMREAPALVVIDLLRKAGATVRVYDPVAMEEARRRIGDEGVHYAGSMYEAAKGADAIALVTEWKQFRMPDWPQLLTLMRDNILVDGRNIFDKEEVLNAGLRYYGIGK